MRIVGIAAIKGLSTVDNTNSILEKIPPQSLEAEQAALGAMLLERDAIAAAVELLHVEDFYRESHRLIFQGILELYNRHEPVDLITLGEWLKAHDALETVGGTLFLTTIMSQVPTAAGITHYCGIIRVKSVQRALIKAADEIMNAAYQGDKELADLIDESQQKIFAISERTISSGFVRLQDLVKEQIYTIDESHASDAPPSSGISTGFTDIDAITAGLHPSELVVLAARPSMGKTAIALNIARNVALNEQQTVAIFSIEMAKEQLALRILCSEAGVNQDAVRHSFLTDEDMMRLAQGVEKLWNCPIFIDDSPMISVLEMRGKARRLKAEHGLGVIIVDYLQLMHTGGRVENRTQEISQIARGLKALAREMKVPVIAISQLSRQVETRSPRRPQLSDLRESGAIEQDADLVAFLYRPAYYGDDELKRVGLDPERDTNVTEFIVAKQRNGPVNTIRLVWRSEYGLFGDYAQNR
jgi:replicative DNA helicase